MNVIPRLSLALAGILMVVASAGCGSSPIPNSGLTAYHKLLARQLDKPVTPREIPDLVTGGMVTVDEGHIIDVVVLGDGYLSTESQTFFNDAQNWYAAMLDPMTGIRPYTFFSNAFRVRAVFASSDERATGARRSYYRVPITGCPGTCSIDGAALIDGLFQYRLFSAVDELDPPVNSRRYPSTLNVGNGSRDVVGRLGGLYSNLVVVMLVRANRGDHGIAENVSGLTDNVAYGDRKVRVAFGETEIHEFGHAFANLADEYIAPGHRGMASVLREPAYGARSVFTLSNLAYTSDPCAVPWRHLAPGSFYNPNSFSPIGNLYAGGIDDRGVVHCEYRCLMNGKADNYACDRDPAAPARSLRDFGHYCFWCEEIVAARILEKTGQFDRPGDPVDINARGRTWYQLWDGALRQQYYERFQIADLIAAKNACYGFGDCPAGQACDGACDTTNQPAELMACGIVRAGNGPCGGVASTALGVRADGELSIGGERGEEAP